jgi:putative membrane protein
MTIAAAVFIGISALEHFYFLVLEMFLYTKPKGLKTFRITREYAESTKALAANQGLYNGFLCAGLIWSLREPNVEFAHSLRVFFLLCVVVAGIYGGHSVNKRIFFLQGVPALIALILVVAGGLN